MSDTTACGRTALINLRESFGETGTKLAARLFGRLPRTEKSCGPDAPTLASSCARRVPARPGSAGNKPARRRWQKSPVAEESAKDTVKTTAQGRPEDPPVPVVLPRAFLLHADHGCERAPGLPCALLFYGGG